MKTLFDMNRFKSSIMSAVFTATMIVSLIFTFFSCQKEDDIRPPASHETASLKNAVIIDCESQCINPDDPVYFELTDSKTITWGNPRNPKTNTVEITCYNTLMHFILKVRSTNGWSDLVINGISSWVNGPVAPGTWGEYAVELPSGWAACDDYGFSLQVAGNGPPAVFDIQYKLIGECDSETVTDTDGNIYNIVTIGNQIWMAENLKTTSYSDGTSIPNVTDMKSWMDLNTGAYCWYKNNETNKETYGALYNWYAISSTSNGGKNLCPDGWHVSSDEDWKQLELYIEMPQTEIDKTIDRLVYSPGALLLKNSSGWSFSGNGTNTTGFSAIPGGYRYSLNGFESPTGLDLGYDAEIGINGWWWTSTEVDINCAYYRIMYSVYPYAIARGNSNYKTNGFSVRCVKD